MRERLTPTVPDIRDRSNWKLHLEEKKYGHPVSRVIVKVPRFIEPPSILINPENISLLGGTCNIKFHGSEHSDRKDHQRAATSHSKIDKNLYR